MWSEEPCARARARRKRGLGEAFVLCSAGIGACLALPLAAADDGGFGDGGQDGGGAEVIAAAAPLGGGSSHAPTPAPTATPETAAPTILTAEETHDQDAYAALALNVTLIVCVMMAYYVRKHKMYYLPESAVALLIGVVIGGIVRVFLSDLTLWTFSPEFFFFVLLPPIIFEAGYSLQRKDFFENIGAITLYAMIGTLISCFVVGYLTFFVGKIGLVSGIDPNNPMEALLFGALISAVDPVATLSIMGSAELKCDRLLYSLVFGESILNDAIAIVLFKTFRKYYDPDAPDLGKAQIPSALLAFVSMTVLSILVGVGLGLVTSYIYRHTTLREFPKLETSLLFLFCYCCYAFAEALELSGIMALFFNGIVLSHYNSYNLSRTSHVASEQIFATLATVTETMVFLYMGMGVFTGRYKSWNVSFSILAMAFCVLARALNIFPLSFLANRCRRSGVNKIPLKMQFVLWFAGLRGAIAFALSANMPGPNRDTYATATLTICIFTTVVCGGFTERILSTMGMKQGESNYGPVIDDEEYDSMIHVSPLTKRVSSQVYKGLKGAWKELDHHYLKDMFGGQGHQHHVDRGDIREYELGIQRSSSSESIETGEDGSLVNRLSRHSKDDL